MFMPLCLSRFYSVALLFAFCLLLFFIRFEKRAVLGYVTLSYVVYVRHARFGLLFLSGSGPQ